MNDRLIEQLLPNLPSEMVSTSSFVSVNVANVLPFVKSTAADMSLSSTRLPTSGGKQCVTNATALLTHTTQWYQKKRVNLTSGWSHVIAERNGRNGSGSRRFWSMERCGDPPEIVVDSIEYFKRFVDFPVPEHYAPQQEEETDGSLIGNPP